MNSICLTVRSLIEWISYLTSESFVLVDAEDNILAQCVGRMPGWEIVNIEACKAMDNTHMNMKTPQRPEEGRRGIFPTLFTGYSFGGGQEVRPAHLLLYLSILMSVLLVLLDSHNVRHEVPGECQGS